MLPTRLNGSRNIDQFFDQAWKSLANPIYDQYREYSITKNSGLYKEGDSSVTWYFMVPGVEKSNLEVSIEDGTLVVNGKRTAPKEGDVTFTMTLPTEIDETEISSKLDHGVLYVTGKKESSKVKKQIKIE